MDRLCPPDGAMKEMEIRTGYAGAGTVYPMQEDGTMHVDNADHARVLRSYGAFTAAGRPAHAAGFICRDCGFRGWFKTCGRCGSDNSVREGIMTDLSPEHAAQVASGTHGETELCDVPTDPRDEGAGLTVEDVVEETLSEPEPEPEAPAVEEVSAHDVPVEDLD